MSDHCPTDLEKVTPTLTRLAVLAAMKRELAPLKRRHLPGLDLIETGMGVEHLEQRLRTELQERGTGAILGIGLAGALSERLRVGDLVIGRQVLGASRLTSSDSLHSLANEVHLQGAAIHSGTVLTVDHMVCSAREKETLASAMDERFVACVDMESWGIARLCSDLRIPFLIVRAISDGFNEDLPLDLNRFRRADGNLDLPRIIAGALHRPRSIGGLWRLRSQANLCAQRLAEFVEGLLLAMGNEVPGRAGFRPAS